MRTRGPVVGASSTPPSSPVRRAMSDDRRRVHRIVSILGAVRKDSADISGPVPDVIIPVLDEAAALPALLAAMPPGYRAIVVDTRSPDASGPLAAAPGATAVPDRRRGLGAAGWSG